MKLICNGNDLNEGVSKVIKAIATRTTNTIMEGIKLKAEPGTLILTATDSELTIEVSIAADVKIEGETVVPGKYFDAFIRKLTKEQITLILEQNNRLVIKYSDSEGVLQCLDAAAYPAVKCLTEGEVIALKRSALRDIINKTAFSACQDDSRPILKGVLIEVDGERMTAVALDGFRLAKSTCELDKPCNSFSCIVPARCFNEAARLLDDSKDIVNVTIQKNYMQLDLGNLIIISRLLDGEFINYRKIMPTAFESVVTLPREQFYYALERAMLLSGTEKNNLVRLDIGGEVMLLSSDSDIGRVQERIPIKLNGSDLAIAFNARYFMELLGKIGCDTVTIKFVSSISPCIVCPCPDEDKLSYLVLPVRIAG